MNLLFRSAFALVSFGIIAIAGAQVNSHSDGSDGAFNPSAATTTVDLGLAPNAAWTTPGSGNGVYDGSKWAVVFKYSSVNIAAGKTVVFTNHPKNPPVVWLVQGDVTIDGTLSLDAASAPSNSGQLSVPGPGGFRGGSNDPGGISRGGGFGPGGSKVNGNYNDEVGASYGAQPTSGDSSSFGPIYGSDQILPLIGGSGAKSFSGSGWAGGAGGGAILIIASGRITISGTIRAVGSSIGVGNYQCSGSGGAIRLVANEIVGAGSLTAVPFSVRGGNGRIRLERLSAGTFFGGTIFPTASSVVLPSAEPTIWPPSTHPMLAVTSVDGVSVPADPTSNFAAPDTQIGPTATSIIRLEAANIPTDGTWRVQVRIVPRSGSDFFVNATFVSGNQVASIWEASVAIPQGGSAVIARAYKL